ITGVTTSPSATAKATLNTRNEGTVKSPNRVTTTTTRAAKPMVTADHDATTSALGSTFVGRRLTSLRTSQSCGRGGILPVRISRSTARVHRTVVMKGRVNVVPTVSAI